ncbi:hypothetical protein D3C85_1783900 [compost metagenome]
MRWPVAICCISLPNCAELLFIELCINAVVCALVIRMVLDSRRSAGYRGCAQNDASISSNNWLAVLMTFMLAW